MMGKSDIGFAKPSMSWEQSIEINLARYYAAAPQKPLRQVVIFIKMVERLRVTLDAFFEFRNGRTYHLKSNKKKQKVVSIFTAGNPERESFVSISRVFNRIIDNMGWQLEGEFFFPASHLLVAEPELLSNQLEAVTMCGQGFVSKGKISKELLEAANREYIDDPETTLHHMTQMILKMRKDNQANSADRKVL